MAEYRIGFMGFGHMAQVLFQALDRAKIVPRSHVLFHRRDAAKAKENEQTFKITSTRLAHLVEQSDVIFLGMRPQQVGVALQELKQVGGFEKKWFISMLAGTPIAYFQTHLKAELQLLRIMPNLPVSVGEGMTMLSYAPACSAEFRSFGALAFGSMGLTAEIPENLMDITSAMAGCMPGFVFRLLEAVARVGEKHGVGHELGLQIAAQAFAGSARLILNGAKPSDLIAQIATPQGVTQAGLDVMTKREIDRHFQEVIEASARRSKELS